MNQCSEINGLRADDASGRLRAIPLPISLGNLAGITSIRLVAVGQNNSNWQRGHICFVVFLFSISPPAIKWAFVTRELIVWRSQQLVERVVPTETEIALGVFSPIASREL
jgi:hypothetical protein